MLVENAGTSQSNPPSTRTESILLPYHLCITPYNGAGRHRPAPCNGPSIKFSGHNALGETFEWCSDSGTNRFVTNNCNDFIKGSQVDFDTSSIFQWRSLQGQGNGCRVACVCWAVMIDHG